MICKVGESNIQEYTEYINKNGNLFQRIEWLKANGQTTYSAIMLKCKEDIAIAGVYIFIEKNGEKCIYFPRGPIFSNAVKYESVREFVEYVKEEGNKHNCKAVIFDCKHGISKEKSTEEAIIGCGFEKDSFSKFWHYNWGIDISEKTIEEYLKQLHQKTRYNINYAIKNGLKITIDNSCQSIDKFYELLCITAKRDGFVPKSNEKYKDLFKYFQDEINLFWVYKEKKLLSAAIHIKVGENAYYVYGASSNVNRELKANYLMHYELIKYSMSRNCKAYHMGGVGIVKDGNKKYHQGLYQFKKKFGGFLQDSSYTYILKTG